MIIYALIVMNDSKGTAHIFGAALAQRARAVFMCVISLRRLVVAEAEELIAAMWYVAEGHGVPSPRLRVRQVGDALDLHIEFRSEEEGALMKRVVPRLALEPSLPKLALMSLYQPARSYRKLVQIFSFAREPTKNTMCEYAHKHRERSLGGRP
jgi:hypothetical protein